jgi:hypothetical protein
MVEAPNEQGDWVEITDKEGMERACLDENI